MTFPAYAGLTNKMAGMTVADSISTPHADGWESFFGHATELISQPVHFKFKISECNDWLTKLY